MLKKLLKYELSYIFKFLIIFYSLSLFFGILARIFISIEDSFIIYVIGQICIGTSIAMIFNITINNIIRLWVRFKSNLYGDESYLTHTLPIEKNTLYLSKVLTAIISTFTSILVVMVTLFIVFYSKENILTIKNILLPIANTFDSTIIKMLLAFIFILFLELINIIQVGYTGIIFGHRKNNNKIGYSVLFGFITYIITQVFGLLIIFIIAIFNQDLMNLFITNEALNINVIKLIIYMGIILYTIIFIINYFINIKVFNKGVNID